MTRNEFFETLKARLGALLESEREKAVQYYEEYFNDALESGKTEQQIIDEIGSIDRIVENIRAEFAFEKAKQKPNARNTGKLVGIILLALFSAPITLPLAITFLAVIITIVAVVFAVVVSLGAAAIALVASAFVTVFVAPIAGVSAVGATFLLIGIGVLLGLATYFIARGCTFLIVSMCRGIYRKLSKNEAKAYGNNIDTKYMVDAETIKEDNSFAESYKEKVPEDDRSAKMKRSISSSLWPLIVVMYLAISFITKMWSVTWIIFLMGGLLQQIVLYILSKPDERKKFYYSILWITTVIVYFIISFAFNTWAWSWMIFLAAIAVQEIIRLISVWRRD